MAKSVDLIRINARREEDARSVPFYINPAHIVWCSREEARHSDGLSYIRIAFVDGSEIRVSGDDEADLVTKLESWSREAPRKLNGTN
jgi:hypothetical protein